MGDAGIQPVLLGRCETSDQWNRASSTTTSFPAWTANSRAQSMTHLRAEQRGREFIARIQFYAWEP